MNNFSILLARINYCSNSLLLLIIIMQLIGPFWSYPIAFWSHPGPIRDCVPCVRGIDPFPIRVRNSYPCPCVSVNPYLCFSWADLKDFFRQAGEVTYTDAHQRMGKNRGEVCFSNREALRKAKDKFDGEEINGRRIKLKITVSARFCRTVAVARLSACRMSYNRPLYTPLLHGYITSFLGGWFS